MSREQPSARELELTASQVRLRILDMIYKAQSGHPGGSLSCADILTALYFGAMRIDPARPDWPGRDRFVLSKGHCCPALYACLAMRGYFALEHLDTLRRYGSILQGHPDRKKAPGVDASTGSLGQGATVAAGMALALKEHGPMVYTLIGDGETQEGIVWEAAQVASKYALDNYVAIIDQNRLQNDGFCEEIMPSGDIGEKYAAFGFDVRRIDGHDMAQIIDALSWAQERGGRPKCIVCATVKGKGVSFMENVGEWHGMAPNDAQYRQAAEEIRKGGAV